MIVDNNLDIEYKIISLITLVNLFMSFITSVEACIPLDILTMLA